MDFINYLTQRKKEIANEEKQLTQSEIDRVINKLAEKDINKENYSMDLSQLDPLFEDQQFSKKNTEK